MSGPGRRAERIKHLGAYDDAPRPVAAMAKAYADGTSTPLHRHRRGQLLHAVSGIMRIETAYAAWLVPPARALWMPPNAVHRVTMRSHVEMRTLYIDAGAATALPARPTLVEVGGLLRELILAALEEPARYDERGRGGLVARLILTELARMRQRTLAVPMPRDPRALRVARALLEQPAIELDLDGWTGRAGASRRTLARLFRGETGLSFAEWRAPPARHRRIGTAFRRSLGRRQRGGGGLRQPERVFRDGSPTTRRAAAPARARGVSVRGAQFQADPLRTEVTGVPAALSRSDRTPETYS